MSALGGKADVIQGVAECPLLAKSGHLLNYTAPVSEGLLYGNSTINYLHLISLKAKQRGLKWILKLKNWFFSSA